MVSGIGDICVNNIRATYLGVRGGGAGVARVEVSTAELLGFTVCLGWVYPI